MDVLGPVLRARLVRAANRQIDQNVALADVAQAVLDVELSIVELSRQLNYLRVRLDNLEELSRKGA